MPSPPKQVLIAHQSTIPHYRVPFYEAVEKSRPDDWEFTVIHDAHASRRDQFAAVDPNQLSFKVLATRTWFIPKVRNGLHFQSFISSARKYDLLVVEDLLKNLSYPFLHLYGLLGKPIMLWGHGQDLSVPNPTGLKRIYEAVKLRLAKRSQGYFAYTAGVKKSLVSRGIKEARIFPLNNTIDIQQQRNTYLQLNGFREQLRSKRGVAEESKLLLYVGRFNRRKRLDLLCDTFTILRNEDPTYQLIAVGDGDTSFIKTIRDNFGPTSVAHYGLTSDLDVLGPLYVISDAFVFPGDVGLGPLQALCYDLTPVVIDSPTHNPEYEYLSGQNSLIAPKGTGARGYAYAIMELFADRARRQELRDHAWPSIKHLTIENMARNFIEGINQVLSKRGRK